MPWTNRLLALLIFHQTQHAMSRMHTLESRPVATSVAAHGFNPQLAILRLGGNIAFLTEYGSLFLKNRHRLLTRIQEAQARNDFEETALAAADVRNIVRNLGMLDAFEIAAELHDSAGRWDVQQLQAAYHDLAAALEHGAEELERWIEGRGELAGVLS